MNAPILTGTGVCVLAGGALALAVGLTGGYTALVGLGGAAPVLVLAALAIVALPDRLEVTRATTGDHVAAGTDLVCVITVGNAGRRPLGWTGVADRADGKEMGSVIAPPVRGGSVTVEYSVPAPRRGLLMLGPLRLERRDPLGLVVRRRTITGPAPIWVHPRVHPLRSLPVGALSDEDGDLGRRAPHGTGTFAGLREYRPGDDPRLIHWRSTARTGSLLVQERVNTHDPAATVVLDARSDVLDEAAFEEAVEVAASIVAAPVPTELVVIGEDLGKLAAMGARSPLDRLAAARRVEKGRVAEMDGHIVLITGAVSRLSAALVVRLDPAATTSTALRRAALTTISAPLAASAIQAIGRLSGERG
ncbi:DUF58 domain-containing protein [Nonomuraea endophytica]|uniref:Uncharacterized protein (DUF58 family) n=1 Tax=Nonomuraea endophytica TaxID=714136 RepID=A0A7W7ZZJ4_9ACTN|nr:DUF58 domain-containing protein [Nonomuraea endophytica]MBB5076747.1 uncharacterized protein (DUF58 family) [Nonomuraea endophytica]